ncbi:SCP-like extracellular, partial [Martensiomyces pterosporus]
VLCLVNKERRRVGLRPLALHPAVTRAAYEHSAYQSRIQSMTHSDPQNGQVGSRLQRNGFNFASAAENIAEAPHASAKEVFDMWISDPPHYENIVDPNATYMGLACINGFWTQDFGS